MIKKLCILFLSVFLIAPVMAQQENGKDDASFKPKKGEWQLSVNLGSGQFFNEIDGMNYLLPKYVKEGNNGSAETPDIGIGEGSTPNQSADPAYYLNLGSLNNNSIVNIASLQAAYFLTNRVQLNAFFSMDLSSTPKKDFIESAYKEDSDPLNLPNYKYIEGRIASKWMAGIGSNYYFSTRNERINLYLGVLAGFQMGKIETVTPYTGEMIKDNVEGEEVEEPIELYRPSQKAGSVYSVRGSFVGGVEFSLMKGLVLGLEVHPVSYAYSVISIQPQGTASYNTTHHNIKAFAFPTLKFGFRF